LAKLVSLIISQITGKKFKNGKLKVRVFFPIFKLCWIIIFGLAFLFMFIGFIYDIAIIIKGQIGTFIYPFIYFIVCFVYVILTFFDYIFNEKFIYLVFKKMDEISHSEEIQDMKNSAPNENRESHKNDENDKRENNKSKNE